jgi:DNA (cytosine-5)-methyltransferase 1
VAAYYNEIDPYAAQWLRNLIAAGHIAPGDVDDRSIEDVRPDDLKQYTQCHFFAGIGVWSYALRLAGWSDDEPVWTMSCPCQPFSAAGKGAGFADERHLWPAAQWLVAERRPAIVFGEQVASKDAEPWLDLVSLDLEAMGYAFGATAFPSAGVGAPHIRDRTYFMAHADNARSQGRKRVRSAGSGSLAGIVADADSIGRTPRGEGCATVGHRAAAQSDCSTGRLADANGGYTGAEREQRRGEQRFLEEDGRIERIEPAGPTNGFWRAADWLLCRDEKWRPVEPGTFPLADGAPSRVGRLRAFGNAINAEAACAFIEAASEALDDYDLI